MGDHGRVEGATLMETGLGRMARAAVATALIVGGCGSDDTVDSTTTTITLPETTTTAQTTTTNPPASLPTDGNAISTTVPVPEDTIQAGNRNPTFPLKILSSTALPIDTRLGVGLYPAYPDRLGFDHLLTEFVESGVHRIDISYSDIEYPIDWSYSETDISWAFDDLIDNLNNQDIAVDYMLHFWDKEGHAAGRELTTPRFQTEDQIEAFLDYIRFIVARYRGRIQYYTIWSEPDACGDGGIKCIEPADYLALAERVIPVIHEVDPGAKVAIAPVVLFYARDYMETMIESDVIADFDVIQWHGIYNATVGDTPLGRYYDEYPEIVAGIKDTAAAHGFEGEYWATEITYCAVDYDSGCPPPDPPLSDVQVAKYYARSFVAHLGMDVGTSYKTYRGTTGPVTFAVFGRSHTLLSGTTPLDIDVEIDTAATDIATAAFTTAVGNSLFALWVDGAPSNEDHRTPASLTFPGMAGAAATGIDMINGVQQQLVTEDRGTDLVVTDLLITDAPVFVRLTGSGSGTAG
jgi:hypothetical protein